MPKMSSIRLDLEHGTISRLAKELQSEGEKISYTCVSNRIYRKSHYETIRRAIAISDEIRRERLQRADEDRRERTEQAESVRREKQRKIKERNAEIRRLIEDAKRRRGVA